MTKNLIGPCLDTVAYNRKLILKNIEYHLYMVFKDFLISITMKVTKPGVILFDLPIIL